MSQENVELHHRSIDAVNRRDLKAFLALMDEDVEVVSRIVAVEGGLHGHDGIHRWWDNWFETFPDYKLEAVGMRDLGDVTIAERRRLGERHRLSTTVKRAGPDLSQPQTGASWPS